MVTIWNPADEAQDFAFTLFFLGGHYTLPLHLEPRATRNFNVSEIIENQVPDAEGNIIPASIHEGGAKIAGSIAENQHILVAIDSGTYNVRKATCSSGCQQCDGYTTAALIDTSFGVAVAGTHQQNFLLTYGSGSQVNFNGQSSWSSNTTSVATVATGLVRGVSAGSATISALVQNEPVQVGQFCGGSQCPTTGFNGNSNGTVANVNCSPSQVTRGGSVTCTATGPTGSTFSNWKFSDGTNSPVSGSGTASTWSGVMVTSGTVSVDITTNNKTANFSASVTVSARNWHTNAASATEVPNGTFFLLPVPPQSTGSDAGLGESQVNFSNNSFSSTFISDSGPNKGYGYYASQPSITTTYPYEINPDLENASSAFYTHQCGNYNAQTKPSGFISGANLLTQTRRHEYDSTTQSHYAFYSASLSGANNPGDYVESRVAAPGTSQSSFDSTTGTTLNNSAPGSCGGTGLYQKICQAAFVQPFAVNDDAFGTFLGDINYAPYTPCN
jgi:hypothetical protein